MALSREQIKAADTEGKKLFPVHVPQWGGEVFVRRITVIEEERYWQIADDIDKGIVSPAGKRGSVVLMATCNEDGSELFTLEDAAWLGGEANKEAVAILFSKIREVSGVTAEAQTGIEKKPEPPTSSLSDGSQTAGASGT